MEIAVFEAMGSLWPKISGRRGHPPPTILRVGKLDELAFHKNVGRDLFRFVTIHAFDRRTDRQTDAHRKTAPA